MIITSSSRLARSMQKSSIQRNFQWTLQKNLLKVAKNKNKNNKTIKNNKIMIKNYKKTEISDNNRSEMTDKEFEPGTIFLFYLSMSI